MKLDLDCIRDILSYIENQSNGKSVIVINPNILSTCMENKYDKDMLIYHFIQCSKSKLIDGFRHADGYDVLYVSDLSPQGHSFLANARNNTLWQKIKNIGCQSLPTIIAVLTEISQKYFLDKLH